MDPLIDNQMVTDFRKASVPASPPTGALIVVNMAMSPKGQEPPSARRPLRREVPPRCVHGCGFRGKGGVALCVFFVADFSAFYGSP